MSRPGKKPHVYVPASISELLSLRKAHPRSIAFSGGTYLMSSFSDTPLTGEIISLRNLHELTRLSRTESYVEIGSCVTLDRLLGLRRYLGMKALFSAFETIGTAPVRSRATLGGNLGLGKGTVNLLPVLYLLEARIEIRKSGNSTWVPVRKYYEGGDTAEDGGLITRIRIPVMRKSFERYELLRTDTGLEAGALSFCCMADVHKDGLLSSFGCSFCLEGTGIIRDMEMESMVEGKKLPLSRKDIGRAVQSIETSLGTLSSPVLSLRRHQITGLVRNTLERIGEE